MSGNKHWESWRLAIEAAEAADRRKRRREAWGLLWIGLVALIAAVLVAALGR